MTKVAKKKTEKNRDANASVITTEKKKKYHRETFAFFFALIFFIMAIESDMQEILQNTVEKDLLELENSNVAVIKTYAEIVERNSAPPNLDVKFC